MKRDLLTLFDLSRREVDRLLERASLFKKVRKKGRRTSPLAGKTLVLLFEKVSTRTRVSFEVAMRELGGSSLYLEGEATQIGRGETYADTARVLSRYAHGLVMRTYGHSVLEEVARAATVPVINGLTDLHHPCQVLADLLTVREVKRGVKKIAYVGDGNNVANSWIQASLLMGFKLVVATPPGFGPRAGLGIDLRRGPVVITTDPIEAVRGADVINTDTWFSMGQGISEEKEKTFWPYQVNRDLLRHAAPGAIVLHCLPAHRGEEITDDVLDGPQSRIWQQAENRLHVQKAVLEMLLK